MKTSTSAQPTCEEIKIILESGDFDKFIGLIENQVFEVKQKAPYQFDDHEKKKNLLAMAELSKDTAAMANGSHGYILFGLKTKPQQENDEIYDFDLVTKEEFYTERDITGRIALSVFPRMENVTLQWYPSKADAAKGIGALYIPQQPNKFYITQITVHEGERLQGGYFGIPIREGAKITWLGAKDVKNITRERPTSTQEQLVNLTKEVREVKEIITEMQTSFTLQQKEDKKAAGDKLAKRLEDLLNE